MNLKLLMIITIIIISIIVFEIILAYNGIILPLIVDTTFWIISDYTESLYVVPYFTDLEIIKKYKKGFPYYHEMYDLHEDKKIINLSAFGQDKKLIDLNIEINADGKLFYKFFCTTEIYVMTKDENIINTKLDQCIEKYGQNLNEVYLIPNPL